METEATPLVTRTVSEVLFYGQPSSEQVGQLVTIKDDGTADWPRLGQTETIEFPLQDPNPDGSVPFTTANSEDQPSAGGSGPRNGLLRILPSREMEIIETTSAGVPVPSDFSGEAQKNTIFLRLKPS